MTLVQSLLESSEPSEESKALEHSIDDVKIRWYCLREKVPEREEQILRVLPLARKFTNSAESFTGWLEVMEKRAEELEPTSLNKDDVTRKCNELKTLNDDVIAREPELRNTENIAKDLMKTASADELIVKAQIDDLSDRFNRLKRDLGTRLQKHNSLQIALKEFENNLEIIERIRDEAEELSNVKVLMASPVEDLLDQLRETKVQCVVGR